jgi:hypothetical protein
MANTLDMRDRIRNGEFENKMEWPAGLKTPARDAGRHAWRDELARLDKLFMTESFKYCGVAKHPKAQLAWDIAQRHGSSFIETFENFEELCDLLK